MSRLQGKVIIVTGGSGLLGTAITKKVADEGGTYINADINDCKTGNFIECDVTNESSVATMLEIVIKNYGKIDGLVNNAYPRTKDWGLIFENIPVESWQKNIDAQLNSVFITCQKLLPVLQRQKSGVIINIASIYGCVGPDFSVYEGTNMTMPAAYSAIKGGIINFTRYLAAYYGPSGLRVNCVSPGGIFDHQNPKFVEHYRSRVPLRRMATPEDIAPIVSFLLSDEASYITGHNIVVDGGWTII